MLLEQTLLTEKSFDETYLSKRQTNEKESSRGNDLNELSKKWRSMYIFRDSLRNLTSCVATRSSNVYEKLNICLDFHIRLFFFSKVKLIFNHTYGFGFESYSDTGNPAFWDFKPKTQKF